MGITDIIKEELERQSLVSKESSDDKYVLDDNEQEKIENATASSIANKLQALIDAIEDEIIDIDDCKINISIRNRMNLKESIKFRGKNRKLFR